MKTQIGILLMSFIMSVIIALVVIPILKKLKVGQIERKDGPQSHLKKQGTPTMGGVIMIIVTIICTIIICLYFIIKNEIESIKYIIPIALFSVGFGIIGLIDDFKKLVLKNTDGLKPKLKMLGLLIIAVSYVIFITLTLKDANQTYIPILKQYITIPVYIYIPFAVLVILGTTNAVNLTDGIDGLCSSVCIIIISCLSIIAAILGIKELALLCAIVVGAILGFLIFNIHPAKVFMGDTGSLFLGGVISIAALYLRMPLILILIAFIPVVETLSVILQVVYFKKTGGKRLFKMSPLHHHFELSGWNENKVVIIFSLITLVCCFIALNII